MDKPTIGGWIWSVMIALAVTIAVVFIHLWKEARRSWRKEPTVMHGLSWTCHACGEERPDAMIGVHKIDVSDHFHMPPGMAFNNVRYCLDRPKCKADAEKIRWVPPQDPEPEE